MTVRELILELVYYDGDCEVVLNGEDLSEEELEHVVDLTLVLHNHAFSTVA